MVDGIRDVEMEVAAESLLGRRALPDEQVADAGVAAVPQVQGGNEAVGGFGKTRRLAGDPVGAAQALVQVENAGLFPLTMLVDRYHPASVRGEQPAMWGTSIVGFGSGATFYSPTASGNPLPGQWSVGAGGTSGSGVTVSRRRMWRSSRISRSWLGRWWNSSCGGTNGRSTVRLST